MTAATTGPTTLQRPETREPPEPVGVLDVDTETTIVFVAVFLLILFATALGLGLLWFARQADAWREEEQGGPDA